MCLAFAKFKRPKSGENETKSSAAAFMLVWSTLTFQIQFGGAEIAHGFRLN